MSDKIKPGDVAPDFVCISTEGTIQLSSYRGKSNVILCFYVANDTPVCNQQLNEFNRDLERFSECNTVVLAINPVSLEKHQEYQKRFRFKIPLVADEDKSISHNYGVLFPLINFVQRTVIIIDKEGIIRYLKRGNPSTDTLIKFIELMNKPASASVSSNS